MRMKHLLATLAAVAALATDSAAQTFDARRMGMGGVILAGALAAAAANVASRAVPPAASRSLEVPLPIGLIPVLADPPSFDPNDADFNAFQLANLLYDPPWNLRLSGERKPSSDVVLSIARDRLPVDLADLADAIPEGDSLSGGVSNGPSLTFGLKVFAGIAPLIEYRNDLQLDDALRGALRHGQAFTPNTTYSLRDDLHGQAALGLHLGAAAPL